MDIQALTATIKDIAIPGKGILAADESNSTIAKRFDTIHVESTEENRRAYRDLLFSTPHLNDYIAGVILFEETLYQHTVNGTPFPTLLSQNGIVPGIKVDKGLISLKASPDEKITQGLDDLAARLMEYKKAGARFAKWRAVYQISDTLPSQSAVDANADMLAHYAALCQKTGIVPIVEPEVLMDGNHSIDRCFDVTKNVQIAVFKALAEYNVKLELMILKPNMVISGKEAENQASIEEVAKKTIGLFRETVPATVPTINFLSGGQSDELATAHLNAINKIGNLPWNLSFSYGRALQSLALKALQGKMENVKLAQEALLKRAKLNGFASEGKYKNNME